VTGKILTAAWRGSKFEIQSVLREVCDSILYDKKVHLNKRLERAQALVLIGDVFIRVRQAFGFCRIRLTVYRLSDLLKRRAIISFSSSSSLRLP
jgi:hypothetical protein